MRSRKAAKEERELEELRARLAEQEAKNRQQGAELEAEKQGRRNAEQATAQAEEKAERAEKAASAATGAPSAATGAPSAATGPPSAATGASISGSLVEGGPSGRRMSALEKAFEGRLIASYHGRGEVPSIYLPVGRGGEDRPVQCLLFSSKNAETCVVYDMTGKRHEFVHDNIGKWKQAPEHLMELIMNRVKEEVGKKKKGKKAPKEDLADYLADMDVRSTASMSTD